MKSLRLALAALLLTTGGCAARTPPSSTPSFAPDSLVLQLRTAGGMVPVAVYLTELPTLSVYGDGRVITSGPVPAIYPGPALPNVQVQHISPADVRKLAGRAVDAGVGVSTDLGVPQIADAPSTRIMVLTASGEKVTDATALGIGGDQDLSPAQRAARKKLQDLVDALTDLPKTLGSGAIDEPRAFEPATVAAVASPWTGTADPVLKDPPPVAWPGPVLPGDPLDGRPDVTCVAAPAAQVLAAARAANSRTPWTSAGASWTLALRPLLPHESGCTDLGH